MAKKFTPYKSKRTFIPPIAPAINMHTIEKYVEDSSKRAWNEAVDVVASAFHIALSDKHGLTTEQLRKLTDDVFTQLECVVGGYVTVDELKQVCSELGVPTDVINHDNITKSINETKNYIKEYEEMKAMKKGAKSIDELADKIFDKNIENKMEEKKVEDKKVFVAAGEEKKKVEEIQIEKITKVTGKFGTYIATNGIINMKLDIVGSAMDKEKFVEYVQELQVVASNV